MDTVRDVLELAALVVGVFGVPIALIGIWMETRRAGKARDAAIIVQVAESVHHRWEARWDATLADIEARQAAGEPISQAQKKELEYMLNWVHWIGVLMKSGLLARPERMILTMGPAMGRIVAAGRDKIAAEERAHGARYWAGAREVERWVARLARSDPP